MLGREPPIKPSGQWIRAVCFVIGRKGCVNRRPSSAKDSGRERDRIALCAALCKACTFASDPVGMVSGRPQSGAQTPLKKKINGRTFPDITAAYRSWRYAAIVVGISINCHGKQNFQFFFDNSFCKHPPTNPI
jgi:hypothetical protein